MLAIVVASTDAWAAASTANPGYDRPGLGFTPAVLQAGDFTFEQGLPDWDRSGDTTTYAADSLLRLGLGHALELQLGSGWNWADVADARTDGRPDTTLAVKYAPPSKGALTWGILGSVEFTDGAAAFRAAHRQYLVGASWNWQRDASHSLGLYAEVQGGDSTSQLLAGNAGWSVTPALGVYVEAAAEHAGGVGYGGEAGAGLAWQASPRVQLDLGARRRIVGHGDAWQGGMGLAIYFGR